MSHFRVVLRGENFWLHMDGRRARMGFRTYRFVEAGNPEEAENAAVELLRSEGRLKPLNERADPPLVFADSIEPIDAADVPAVVPGFAFYPDESDAEP